MLDLVCKNCVISLKDILIGYDLNEFLYGLIPKEKNQIIHLEEDNTDKNEEIQDKKDKNKDNKKEKEINLEKKDKINNIFENKIENSNINIEKEKKRDISLLCKKRKDSLNLPFDDIKDEKNENEIETNEENKNNIKNSNLKDDDKNNNNNKINNISLCKRKKNAKSEEILNNIIKQEQNIFIDCEIFLKNLCRCESCQKMYNSLGFDYLNNENLYKEWQSRKTFDDIINDEKFIDEAERENPISLESVNGTLNDFFNSKEYKQLTCKKQIIKRGCLGELGNKFAEFVSTLNHTTITVEDIYAFFNKYGDYFEKLKNK